MTDQLIGDPDLLDPGLRTAYAQEGWVPLLREDDGSVLVAVSSPLTPAARDRIEAALARPVTELAVPQGDIVSLVVGAFPREFAESAADGLWRKDPGRSAREVLSRGQKVALALTTPCVIAALVLWPAVSLIVAMAVVSVFFLASVTLKFAVALRGSRYDLVSRVSPRELAAIGDSELPLYTVLVPVFREARVVGRLVENLGRLDYPVDKLEVLILVEEEDDETRDAIAASDPPPHFVVVTVPKGQPQTKPRACNVGLEVARGEFLVIYDAEDAPEPDQLKKTVIAFRRAGPETAVIQAALNYFNARENVITRLFALEYSCWFDYMLTGLDAWNLPIPLGGTSNHFRTGALRELGGWDPYNVTEDADLGIRASALGYRVGVIDSTTMEEATSRAGIFVGQRSRWIKGYMQTSLVHARHPVRLVREIGLRRFLSFALLIAGTPVTFLGVIPFTVLMIATVLIPAEWIPIEVPLPIVWLSILNFLIGYGLMIYMHMMGPYKRGAFWLVGWVLLKPAFWMLHSVASYKALWQLIVKPHYWEKTEHGLSDFTLEPDAQVRAAAPVPGEDVSVEV